MRLILSALMMFLFVSCSPAYAQILCPSYTDEQLDRIHAAYDYGIAEGYELTLPAIVIQEAFVGDKIIRYNPSDPSTGITQIHFRTLRALSGLNRYDAANEAARLVNDDSLAFYYAVEKLRSIKSTSYWYKWKRYNGSGPAAIKYANRIRTLTLQLRYCQNFQIPTYQGQQ
jgi:hypothetical protein